MADAFHVRCPAPSESYVCSRVLSKQLPPRPFTQLRLFPSVAHQHSSFLLSLFPFSFLSFSFFFFFYFFSYFSTRRACKRHTVKIPRVGIGKSIARDAFKFHADSPVELITDIRHAATFPANFHQQFPAAQLRALFELPIEFTGCNCDEKKSPTGSRSSTVHYVQFKRMFLSARRSANT